MLASFQEAKVEETLVDLEKEKFEDEQITLQNFVEDWAFQDYTFLSEVGSIKVIENLEKYPQIFSGNYIYTNEEDGETLYFETKIEKQVIQVTTKANYAVIPKAEILVISNNPSEKHADFLKAYLVKQGKLDKIEFEINSSDEESISTLKKRFYETAGGLIDCYHPKSITCFNALKQSLHRNVPVYKCFKNLGYFKAINFHVYSNGFIDLEDTIFYEFLGDEKLAHHKSGSIYCLSDDIEEKFIFNPKVNGKEVARKYFKAIKATFNDISFQVGLFTALGSVFEDIFWGFQGMPMILFLGKSQTGKSLLQYSIAAIFGILNANNFTSGSSTLKALRNELEKFCNVAVFIEELSAERMQELPIICKDIFSRTPRKTSSKDGKTLIQPINTTICACSNEFIQDLKPETLSRIIFTDAKELLESVDTFPFLKNEELSELSAILPEILKFRPHIEKLYNDCFNAISPEVGAEKRLCNNLAIACTMATIVNKICDETIFELNKIIPEYLRFYKQYLFSQGSELDLILIELDRYITNGQLVYGQDYLLSGDSNLRLKLSSFLHLYNSGHAKLNSRQCKLIMNRGRNFNTNATPIGDIGRAIHIKIEDNQDLLELLTGKREILTVAIKTAQELLKGQSSENIKTKE